MIQTKQNLEKQLEQAYAILNDLKDRIAQGEHVSNLTLYVWKTHIAYLKSCIAEAS